MGVWSVAIVDSGVTDEAEASHGANLYEYDFYYGNNETDGGRTVSHGSWVAETVEQTNPALERLDLQVSSNSEYFWSSTAINNALSQVVTLHDQGWHVGAVNMSFGGSSWTASAGFQAQIDALASRGIISVAASGNGGSSSTFESALYPAALSNVISVGSHDGSGNPTWFSQSSPSAVHILADGEDVPSAGINGTSFAAPAVAATVTTVQALVEGVTSDRLSFDEMVSTLQMGGAGPQSNPDPADGQTTYFLHDHAGSVSYALSTYVDPVFNGLEYIASYSDLETAFGRDASAARAHYIDLGVYEGRTVDFDGLEYIASHADLMSAFGADRATGALHYLNTSQAEGRATTFDADAYLAANADLAAAFAGDESLAAAHYINHGFAEGRVTSGAPSDTTEVPIVTEEPAVSEGSADLPRSTATSGYVGVDQSVTGTIGYWGDRDWFRTEFTSGETVVIQARGSASGGGTIYDPELYVRDSSGSLLAYNWDSGAGRDAYLTYTPTTSGTHYLEVDGYWFYTGSYTLKVASQSSSSLTATADPAPAAAGKDPSLDPEYAAVVAGSSDPFGLL